MAERVAIPTHAKVSGEDVVGGDHHILRGQKLLAPVAIGAVVQIHVHLDVGAQVLLKLFLETKNAQVPDCRLVLFRECELVPTSQLLSTDSGATIRVALASVSSAPSGTAASEPACSESPQQKRRWNLRRDQMALGPEAGLTLS